MVRMNIVLGEVMQNFRSKIDWWVWGFVISMTGLLAQLLVNMYAKGTLQQNLVFVTVYVLAIALLWWPLLSTRYQIQDQRLWVKSMFLKWEIPLDAITGIKATDHSMLAPALSFKRVRVDYVQAGQEKFILLSPHNMQAFQMALQQRQQA